MNHKKIEAFIKKSVQAVGLQSVLSAASLPFLLWWHIPFPLLSIVGNLLHPFFLTSFLFLSSALFFAALIGLPTTLLSFLLTRLTHYWDYLLRINIPSYWIALKWWHVIPAISIAILFIWWHLLADLFTAHKKKQTIFLIVLNAITFLWQLSATHAPAVTILHRKNNHLLCIPHKDYIELIDFGFISSARNKESVMTYEVMPHVLFCYGMNKIKNKIR